MMVRGWQCAATEMSRYYLCGVFHRWSLVHLKPFYLYFVPSKVMNHELNIKLTGFNKASLLSG